MMFNRILGLIAINVVLHGTLWAQKSALPEGAKAKPAPNQGQPKPNPQIDYAGFLRLAQKVEPIRAKQRVPFEKFMKMASEPNTIVLDTRSKQAFETFHLANATHLNFSDFTQAKLAEIIPDKKTRILIYCNNNFLPPGTFRAKDGTLVIDPAREVLDPTKYLSKQFDAPEEVIRGSALKKPGLALNIPTFVNLWGYGYKNTYELADSIALDDPRLKAAGTGVRSPNQEPSDPTVPPPVAQSAR